MNGSASLRLADRIREAKAEVERLQHQAGAATCADMGEHDWRQIGGCGCGCDDGGCSIPVHECSRCGDCDYGDTAEATEIRAKCAKDFDEHCRRMEVFAEARALASETGGRDE